MFHYDSSRNVYSYNMARYKREDGGLSAVLEAVRFRYLKSPVGSIESHHDAGGSVFLDS